MAYGLTCYNGSDELTLSSDGITYGYLGKATHVSTTQPFGDTVSAFNGYSTYTINWTSDIIVALPLSTTKPTAVLSMDYSAGTWTIKVYYPGTTTNEFGFLDQVPTEVFVFGRPISASGHGLALYDAAGNLTADLSMAPLVTGLMLDFSDTETAKPFSGFTKPAVIGGDTTERRYSTEPSGGFWPHYGFQGGWQWDSGSSLSRPLFQVERVQEDSPLTDTTSRWPVSAILIEAAGLT